MTEETQLVPTLSPKQIQAALQEIKTRSFSGRNPQYGKMINCHCGHRHREFDAYTKYIVDLDTGIRTKETVVLRPACEQKFAKDPEGNERNLARMTQTKNTVLGARMFKGKRIKPHLNKRKLRFVEIVRNLLPDEYTQEDMEQARRTAARQLSRIFGRYNILPALWRKNVNGPKQGDSGNQDVPAGPEAIQDNQ